MLINVPKDLKTTNTVPPAIYRVRCTAFKTRTSKAGNLCISPELTIQNQGPDESVKTVGRKVFDNWTLTEDCLPIINTAYKALTGVDLPAGQFEIDEFVGMVTSNILNREALVQVEVSPDPNGVDRNQIKRWTRIEG